MRARPCWVVFVILAGLFIVGITPIGALFHLRDFRDAVAPLGILGAILVLLAAMAKISRLLKGCFLATGISAAGLPASLYLHRVLVSFIPNEPFTYVMFFYIFMPAFMIGAAGTIVVGLKQLVFSR